MALGAWNTELDKNKKRRQTDPYLAHNFNVHFKNVKGVN